MMFRSRKIIQAAKHARCTRRGCLSAYSPVAACHSNWQEHGKGKGLKAHDCFIAFMCQRCHDLIDGRVPGLTPEERKEQWRLAHDATILWLFMEGVIE